MASRSAATLTLNLQNSIVFEDLKRHFGKIMQQYDVDINEQDESELNEDIVREYLEAAKFSNTTFGTKYRTFHLEQWLEWKTTGHVNPI